jgi:hypothetical protein
MLMGKRSTTTTLTFAVTFRVPDGITIADAREHIRQALIDQDDLGIEDDTNLKVSLTNKEVQYGKR